MTIKYKTVNLTHSSYSLTQPSILGKKKIEECWYKYFWGSFMVIFETTCAELLIECHGCSPGLMQECRDNILIKFLFLALTRLQREMWVTTCCFTCFYGQPRHTAHPSPNTIKPVSAYVNTRPEAQLSGWPCSD